MTFEEWLEELDATIDTDEKALYKSAWQAGYEQGIEDERTLWFNKGIASGNVIECKEHTDKKDQS